MAGHIRSILAVCLAMVGCLSSVSVAAQSTETPLRVAFNHTLPPFQFVRASGEQAGMHIDMLDWIAHTRGFRLEYLPLEDDNACLAALSGGQADLILGYQVDSASYGYQSTAELSSSSLCMIAAMDTAKTLDSREDYTARTAALEYGSMSFSHMYRLGLRNYYVYGNQSEVCSALTGGTVDIAVGVRETLSYLLSEQGLDGQYTIVHNYLSPISYSILLRPQDGELFRSLDAGIAELRADGEYEKIYRRWVVNRDRLEAENARRLAFRLLQVMVVVALAALLIIGFNARMNIRLRHLVEDRTAELRRSNTELEQRMAQLGSEGDLRNNIIENSQSGMLFFDVSGHITLANAAAQRIVAPPSDAVSGAGTTLTGADVCSVPVFGELLRQLERDESAESGSARPVIIDIERDGKTYSYRCALYRPDKFSSIQGLLLTAEDVTHEERQKQALFEAEKNKTLNRLVAGIAHEIKNPLMSIRTAASLIQSQGDDPEVKQAFSTFVPSEIGRIDQLIEGLINYARPIAGEPEDLDLTAVVRECLYMAQLAGKRVQIHFHAEIADGLVVHARKNQLKQSLINLIMNGVESLEQKLVDALEPPLLRLDLLAYAEADLASIVIRDSGMGMTQRELARCTNPFFTTKSSGTGLGLAIAKQYIQENHGTLRIESALGEYTQITLSYRRVCLHET